MKKTKNKKLFEVTSENFGDICEDMPGFCMIGFLPGNVGDDYSASDHDDYIEILKK